MAYLIYDTESIIDRERLIRTEGLDRPGVTGDREQLIDKKLEEVCTDKGKEAGCFIPVTYHAPVCAVMLLVDNQLNYMAHRVIAHTKDGKPDFERNTNEYWSLYNQARQSNPGQLTLVDFNGCSFDSPMMEQAGIAYGADLSQWLYLDTKAWDDPRNRNYFKARLDLYQFLVGRSGNRDGSLNFWSRLIGLPGKLDTEGDSVAALMKAHDGLERVKTYCCADVCNTYGILFQTLHSMRMVTTGWRCPIFHDTIAKMAAGMGPEMQTFQRYCLADGPLF